MRNPPPRTAVTLSAASPYPRMASPGVIIVDCFSQALFSHRPLWRVRQEFLLLLLVEPGAAGGEVAAGLGARWNEIELAVLDLLEGCFGDAGFRRVALVIG